MKTLINLSLCLTLILFASACATIKHGTMQPVPVSSEPPNADVFFNGAALGKTPTVLNLSRSSEGAGIVKVSLDGYKDADVQIKRRLSGAFWGNLLFGGVVGMAIDFITGGWANLNPKEIKVNLVKASSATVPLPSSVSIPVPVETQKVETKKCTTAQILSLVESGLSPEQIKAGCGQ